MANSAEAGAWVRRAAWPDRDVGPLIGLTLMLRPRILRLGPAWAVLAGWVAGGGALDGAAGMLRLLGAIWLADLAWGALWDPGPESGSRRTLRDGGSASLPYAVPGSPLDHLGAFLGKALPGMVWNHWLLALVLATGLSLLLGGWVVLLTLQVALISLVLHYQLRHHFTWSHLAASLLAVGLPWMLGWMVQQTQQVPLVGRAALMPVAAGLALSSLEWGVQRARGEASVRVGGIWLGHVAVVAVLIAARQAWAVSLATALSFLPTLWLLGTMAKAHSTIDEMRAAISRGFVCWWFILFVVALAVRQAGPS